jgi:hypothetical protein
MWFVMRRYRSCVEKMAEWLVYNELEVVWRGRSWPSSRYSPGIIMERLKTPSPPKNLEKPASGFEHKIASHPNLKEKVVAH